MEDRFRKRLGYYRSKLATFHHHCLCATKRKTLPADAVIIYRSVPTGSLFLFLNRYAKFEHYVMFAALFKVGIGRTKIAPEPIRLDGGRDLHKCKVGVSKPALTKRSLDGRSTPMIRTNPPVTANNLIIWKLSNIYGGCVILSAVQISPGLIKY